jgi:hypothetical protein
MEIRQHILSTRHLFFLMYDGDHDWVVTICPNGLAVVINGPSFDFPTLKLVTLLQDDLDIDHRLPIDNLSSAG